jgi:hypothetical protein
MTGHLPYRSPGKTRRDAELFEYQREVDSLLAQENIPMSRELSAAKFLGDVG